MQKTIFILVFIATLLQSCYYQHQRKAAWEADEEAADSLEFVTLHHYSEGFNFVVHVDSLALCTEIPSRAQQLAVMPDSIDVYRGDELIVAEIELVPEMASDSIWVKVARDQQTQGWIRESVLLSAVSPDDPISLAIYYFSGNHVWGTVVLVGLLAIIVLVRFLLRRRSAGVLFLYQKVSSPYPLLLSVSLGGSAVFYASMQLFAPQEWTEYYFHPTLNPFAVSPLLGAFLFSFWLMVLFFIATLDDTFHQLRFGQAVLYLFSLITALAVMYIFFSLTTLVFLGYLFYVLFVLLSVRTYFRHVHPRYCCGFCGRPLHEKGECPRCGIINE